MDKKELDMIIKNKIPNTPSKHNIDKGWVGFDEDKNKVKILHYDEELVIAEKVGSKGEIYTISCYWGYWRCTCYDWMNRWTKIEGAYLCKHIQEVIFEISYRKYHDIKMVE